MAEKRPVPGKHSKFAIGDDVILHGSVTRVGEDSRGEEEITVTIKGWEISKVTISAAYVDKAKK